MDVEKTIEFILATQARIEASVEKHTEMLAKHDEMLAKHDQAIATLTELVGRVAQAQMRAVEQMTTGFKEFRALLAESDSKLNALIDTVDKLVRRNGNKD